MQRWLILCCFVCISAIQSNAQPLVKITGTVTNEQNTPLQDVTVSVVGQAISVLTDHSGQYVIYSPVTTFELKFNLFGYTNEYIKVSERKAGRIARNIQMRVSVNELEQISITDKQNQLSNSTTLNIGDIRSLPSVSGNFETMLKTLPGVSVNNELSAQYSVRGGNFDENLLYVNEVEVSRPNFFRNGQQEGLSFVNSDLVTRAKFASGGFESKYGNKLSSALDVQYGRPDTSETIVSAGLLGATIAVKQPFKSSYFLFGARYKNNRSVLGKQDVSGSYQPNFGDVQLLYQFTAAPKLKIEFMGNLNGGRFQLTPAGRETEFGTVSTNLHLNIGFSGEEKSRYLSTGLAVTANYLPKPNLSLKWITSQYTSDENEDANIVGAYFLDEITLNKPVPNINVNRSVGKYLLFTDNFLRSRTLATEVRADQNIGSHVFSWGMRFQQKRTIEDINELNQINNTDPVSPTNLYTDYAILANNRLNIRNISAYIQDSYTIGAHTDLQLGVRASYNSTNDKVTISPRLLLAFRPALDDKILRFSAGVYYQDPDYKTIKNIEGSLNLNQLSQRSYNTTLGYDYAFNALGTRLKLSSELYFKYSDRLVPYIVDNLKIRYLSDKTASGYTYGADVNLGGEFVKDLISYFRISFLKANQDIIGDSYVQTVLGAPVTIHPGYLKRPTDQRVNFSMFFQDKLLTSPSYKVHLTLLYGSRLPVGAPNFKRYSDTFRIPAYKRVDIGFSKDFLDESLKSKPLLFNQRFSSFIAYFEIFNLLNINNTASYLWLKDVNGAQYAIPNYLTGRQFNFKLIAKFKGK